MTGVQTCALPICSNIAVCVTEIDRGEFDTHEYLNTVKSGNDARYKADFAEYAKKYELKYAHPSVHK